MTSSPSIMEKEKEVLSNNPIKVGVTIGDINGIGPEIIIKCFNDPRMLIDCVPVIYGNTKVLAHYKKVLNDQDFVYQTCKSGDEAIPKKVNIVNAWNEEVNVVEGEISDIGGKCAFHALEKATEDLAAGKIDALVTAPISKEAMAKSGFQFPGHTEYLSHLAGGEEVLMTMVSDALRVALVTTHVALKDVPSQLNKEHIFAKIKLFESSLKKDFGIVRPKIAVLGLNPHAGENGKMGTEEQEAISPAIQLARNENILAFGPYPADGLFGSDLRSQFDGILAMYHDQGLTGFKALAFEDGVNFTAGLPIVRTSPDHGTAFDIAGKNKANEQSFRSAVYLAMDVFKARKLYKEITSNPLVSAPREKKKYESSIE